MAKLWGGRFNKATDKKVDDFNSSIAFDARLYKQDITGSIAHATMLGSVGIITPEESQLIVQTLKEILADIEAGKVAFSIDAEDIHMNIETILIDRIGDVGKKLHTGRSRNDQVALDIRMYIKDEITEISKLLRHTMQTILTKAEQNTDTIMPGYTHLQKAQPITFAHYLLAYFQMFRRDYGRLQDTYKRCDVMPLGSGALAGTTFPLDRELVKNLLGFSSITENSLDGVSDRDFALELLSALSILSVHLSRMSEEMILFNTHEFSYIEMDDAFSTGSSIMPQKKNPDIAELVRGKSGRVFGDLMALLTVMKGLPLAYNKDMQEDKEAIFDAIDTIKMCLPIFTDMLSTLTIRKENMRKGAAGGFTNATDYADYLVKKGVPFREAHGISGRTVFYCISQNKALEDLSLEEFKTFSPLIEEDVYSAIALETCVNERKIYGGPAKEAVLTAIQNAKEFLDTI